MCNAAIAISTWQAIPDLTEEELVAAFREADTSGNGTLDVEEGNPVSYTHLTLPTILLV